MPAILCPTRGGEASYPNQDRAIALANEQGADLIFLYVADARFLGGTAGAVLVDLEEELEGMGEFLLEMAKERAEKQGLSAGSEVLSGSFREALSQAIQEYGITTVVLGSPGEESNITTDAYLETLTESLVKGQRVEVVIVRDGEIVRQQGP